MAVNYAENNVIPVMVACLQAPIQSRHMHRGMTPENNFAMPDLTLVRGTPSCHCEWRCFGLTASALPCLPNPECRRGVGVPHDSDTTRTSCVSKLPA